MPGTQSLHSALAYIALASCSIPARAELVYFEKGGQAQLPATIEGETVRLDTPDGVVEFRRDEFRKIVPGFWPAREWNARREAALAKGVEERYAAAWWALENGLTPQAVAMIRDAAALDPKYPPIARMIAALDRLAKPCADPPLEALAKTLGEKAREARGPHVVLVHQHDESEANERIDLLERVVTSYYLTFAALGIELPEPSTRLASAWFAERDDYIAYLKSENAGAFLTTRGYYHPTRGAVVAYDCRSDTDRQTARTQIAARWEELSHLSRAVRRLRSPTDRLRLDLPGEGAKQFDRAQALDKIAEFERDLKRRELLMDLDRRALDLGTAAHEMIHQLMARTGLPARHHEFPQWLHEGLAAQFEVYRGGRWAGISRAHDFRLPDWRKLKNPPELKPLLKDEGFGHGYARDVYAQSWALVYFLRKEHPAEFTTFLDLLRAPDPENRKDSERILARFQEAFGDDLDALEESWIEFIDAEQTPLDENG